MSTLPKYKITIDPQYSDGEDLGIQQIAFTANPAIKVKGFAFKAAEKKKFFTDASKMRIVAPALIPMEIYRNDEDGEYYVEFTADEIEALTSKFMLNLNNSGKFNLEHNEAKTVPAYILEAWIVDKPLEDKAYSTFGIEVPKGTLMVVSQLTDKAYYDSLVANNQIGYSIEGFLGLKLSDLEQLKKEMNKNKLNNNEMKDKLSSAGVLPEGTEFEIDGVKYAVKDGEVVCLDKPMAAAAETPKDETPTEDATPTEEPVEEVKKEDKPAEVKAAATDPVAPEAIAPEATPLDEAAILAIIQPKLDEIYQMIADLKAADIEEDATEDTSVKPTNLSIHEKFAAVMKLTRED